MQLNCVRISCAVVAAALIALAAIPGLAQPRLDIYVDTAMIPVGSSKAEIRVFSPQSLSNYVLKWNGEDRPVRTESGSYYLELAADDLARHGLGELAIVNRGDGATFGTWFIPIGYNVLVRDVLYDSARKRCYLTTPERPDDTRFAGDSLISLNPETGEIGATVAIGKGPGQLALSEDGSTLYVVLEADGVVKQLNAESLAVISEFRFRSAVASNAFGHALAALAVLPGSNSTLAMFYAPDTLSSLHRLAVYDNGVKRHNEYSSQDPFDGLRFSPDGKYVFLGSYAHFNSPQVVSRYLIDASGVPDQKPLLAAGGGPVHFSGDLLYTSRGTIVNCRTMEVVSGIGIGGALGVDEVRSRILTSYFVPQYYVSEYPQYLQAFDLKSQLPLGWLRLGSINYFAAGASPTQRLLRFGTDGLIFTDSRGLFIFHTPLAGLGPVLEPSGILNAEGQPVSSIAPGDHLSLHGDNLGPDPGMDSGGRLTWLGHVQVWFDGEPGILRYVSKNQVNVIVPDRLTPDSTIRLQLWYYGLPTARFDLLVRSR